MSSRDDVATFTAADRQFVLATARRIVGDSDAPDVAQDALLRAYRYRAQFRGESAFRGWLYRIATSVSLSHLRRRRRQLAVVTSAGDDEVALAPTADSSPEELVARAQEHHRLRESLARLAPRYAEVLKLRFEHGLTEEAVAKALGTTVANVKIRAFRGRRQLREPLRGERLRQGAVTGDAARPQQAAPRRASGSGSR